MAALTKHQKDVLAYTLLTEARGEGQKGMEAVAWVIRNRSESGKFPSNPASVATQKSANGNHQFSGWNGPTKSFSSAEKSAALKAIDTVFSSDQETDPTNGAIGYYANKGANAIAAPGWFGRITQGGVSTQIGNHVFASPGGVRAISINPDGTEVDDSPPMPRPRPDPNRHLLGGEPGDASFGVRLSDHADMSKSINPADITESFMAAVGDTGLASAADPRLDRLLAVQRAQQRRAGVDTRDAHSQDQPSGLTTRRVPLIPVDQYGQPIVPRLQFVPQDVAQGVTDSESAQVAEATAETVLSDATRANPATSMIRKPGQEKRDIAVGHVANQQQAPGMLPFGTVDNPPEPPAPGDVKDTHEGNVDAMTAELRKNGFIDTTPETGVSEFALPPEYHPSVMEALNGQLINASGSPDDRKSTEVNTSGSPDDRDHAGMVAQPVPTGPSSLGSFQPYKYETRLVTTDVPNPDFLTYKQAHAAGGDTKEGHGAITNIQAVAPPATIKKTVSIKVRVAGPAVAQTVASRIGAPIITAGSMVMRPAQNPSNYTPASETAYNAGQKSYDTGERLMPTTTVTGEKRNTYGDASLNKILYNHNSV